MRSLEMVDQMTLQHIAGELSQILGELEALGADERSVRELGRLRRQAETWPLAALPSVTVRALALTDDLCWASLAHADTGRFARQAAMGASLHELGLCAGLLESDQRWR